MSRRPPRIRWQDLARGSALLIVSVELVLLAAGQAWTERDQALTAIALVIITAATAAERRNGQ